MRTVVLTDRGTLELNWVWLPTFIGMDAAVRRDLREAIAAKVMGRPATEEVLEEAHQAVCAFLCKRYPALQGLGEYLSELRLIGVVS